MKEYEFEPIEAISKIKSRRGIYDEIVQEFNKSDYIAVKLKMNPEISAKTVAGSLRNATKRCKLDEIKVTTRNNEVFLYGG